MKIFQLWLVFNSCIFMLLYFMAFLKLKYSAATSVFICIVAAAIPVISEILRIHFAFDAIFPKLIVTSLNVLILQGTALLLSNHIDAYTLFIGFSSSNFVLAGNIVSCGTLILFF